MSELEQKAGKKLEKAIAILAIITLVIALLFPLIIWDALGSGAMHFMQYSHVSVAGSSAGDSKATFLFGLDYTLIHMGPGIFIPAQLFSAQWRVVLGTTEASSLADNLGAITMVLMVMLFVTVVVQPVVYLLDRHTKGSRIHQAAKIVAAVCGCVELITAVWFGIVVLSMAGKVSNYGFRIYDFAAYGGFKFTLETVFSLVMGILNGILFAKLLKESKKPA